MRKLLLFVLLPCLFTAGLGLNLWAGRQHRPPTMPPLVAARHGQRMANIDLAGLTPAAIEARIAAAAADGHSLLRLRLSWNEVQPQADVWRWQGLETSLDAAQQQGLAVLLLLDGSPAWARETIDADNPLAPPGDIRAFGHFAAQVAQQAQGRVLAYQIWDEPNIAPHWGARWVDAAAYARLLREAALSIHQVDARAQIVLATLAPTTADDGANLSDLDYLRQLYEQKAAAWFDIVGANALGFDLPPDAMPAADRLNFRRPELLYAIMAAQGDAAKPLWITSWGWWVPSAAQASSPWGQIEAEALPATVQQAWDWAQTHWPWAGPMAWTSYWPSPTADPLRAGFAQRTTAGAETSTGAILRRLALDEVAGNGRWPVTAPAIAYAPGQWRLSPTAADPAAGSASLGLRWQGQALALTVQRGPYRGVIRAWIDGQPAPALPRDEQGDAYLLLYDPENAEVTVPLARRLPTGEHELRLQISGGWSQWPLRQFVVLDQPWPRPWPLWSFSIGLLLALAWSLWRLRRELRQPTAQHLLRTLEQGWQQSSTWFATWHPAGHVPLALALLLAFYMAPHWILSLLVGGLLALLLALRLELAPWLIVPALPFYTHPKLLGAIGLPLHELMIWLVAAVALLRWGIHRLQAAPADTSPFTPLQPWRGLDWPVFGLLLIGGLAVLSAQRFGFALYDWRITLLTPTLLYFFLTRLHTPDQPFALTIADALALSALLLSLLGVRQWWMGESIFVEGVPRISAGYGSPNNLALYLGRVWPLLLIGAVLGLDEKRMSPRRLFYVITFVLTTTVAFLTFSKGLLLISIPVALLLLAVLEKRLRWPVIALFAVGALALLPFLGTERFRDLLNTQSGTTFLRLQLWQSAWHMWLDHPWFGVGPDNFLYAYRSTYALPSAWEELNLSHPHNLILDLLTRLGIFGLVAGLAMVGEALRRGAQAWRSALPSQAVEQRIWGGLWVGFVAGMAHGLIDNSLFLADLSVLTMVVMALLQRHSSAPRSRA
ncbi:MAG: O-antigen ligase family protein [Chloroflexi bacterium]|nr:O-antigen ligase family protein [Chloroflexota bacterium]